MKIYLRLYRLLNCCVFCNDLSLTVFKKNVVCTFRQKEWITAMYSLCDKNHAHKIAEVGNKE
jgi:hypothetical protein